MSIYVARSLGEAAKLLHISRGTLQQRIEKYGIGTKINGQWHFTQQDLDYPVPPTGRPPTNPRTCSVPGCHALSYSRTYCAMHDQRMRRHGDPQYERPYYTSCTVPGCERSTTGGRKLCGAHTARAYRLRKGGHL